VENVRNTNLFHNRVVNHWNKLPDSVVMAVSVDSFKKHLSSFLGLIYGDCQQTVVYGADVNCTILPVITNI